MVSSGYWLNTACSSSQRGSPFFLNFLATFFFIILAIDILCWAGGRGLTTQATYMFGEVVLHHKDITNYGLLIEIHCFFNGGVIYV